MGSEGLSVDGLGEIEDALSFGVFDEVSDKLETLSRSQFFAFSYALLICKKRLGFSRKKLSTFSGVQAGGQSGADGSGLRGLPVASRRRGKFFQDLIARRINSELVSVKLSLRNS